MEDTKLLQLYLGKTMMKFDIEDWFSRQRGYHAFEPQLYSFPENVINQVWENRWLGRSDIFCEVGKALS